MTMTAMTVEISQITKVGLDNILSPFWWRCIVKPCGLA
jgi:hypothetical protein